MMRNSVSSSMQKTYDECFLICSTAVYYEGQNNEAEALRSWRSALDQIYYLNAYRVPGNYRPRTEYEKTLLESLRSMELQCKERVDLLDALQQSRRQAKTSATPSASSSVTTLTSTSQIEPEKEKPAGLGEGTVPAMTYPELARSAPPPLPRRPGMPASRKSATDLPTKSNASRPSGSPGPLASSGLALPTRPKKTSRSPSPEKKTGLLMTLRNGRDGKRMSRSPGAIGQRKESGPAAAKAATQAWGSLSRAVGDRLAPRMGDGGSATQLNLARRRSAEFDDGYDNNASGPRPESRRNVSERPSSPSRNPLSLQPGRSERAKAFGVQPPLRNPVQDDARETDYSLSRSMGENASSRDASNTGQRRSQDYSDRIARGSRPPDKSDNAGFEWPTFHRSGTDTGEQASRPPVSLRPPQTDTTESQSTRARQARAAQGGVVSGGRSAKGLTRQPMANSSTPQSGGARGRNPGGSSSEDDLVDRQQADGNKREAQRQPSRRRQHRHQREDPILANAPRSPASSRSRSPSPGLSAEARAWRERVDQLIKNLPRGVDEQAAKQILNEIVIQGDEVHWDDVAGLEVAKKALKEAVVYPFLRPDLFMGLREPARGMLLFGPPGTGKTMLARAVATESRSTFFSISASSLTSKYLGDSEKLVRALFGLAKALAPSIIFVDEIDSLLSSRSGSGADNEATRRIKTEFLIQWSDLARAAAGREQSDKDKERGDASRVLVLAATNLPWAIDEAARRRFVRRQYIPLPEPDVRAKQFRTLLGHQKHDLTEEDLGKLVEWTEGFSGSDITALAKDAAMGPLRSLGEALLLCTSPDAIPPIALADFHTSLSTIRPSVSKDGLKAFEDWAREFGERGG